METFDPTAWRIKQSFTHRGCVYSPGEPMPTDLTVEEAETLYLSRHLALVAEDGTSALAPRPEPATPEQYLRASDLMVLRRIRKYRPSADTMRAMLAELDRSGRAMRSTVLYEALRALVADEVGPKEAIF